MVAKIIMWEYLVGAVLWDAKEGYARFEFDEKFLKLGLDIAPIQMPIGEALLQPKIYVFPALERETYKGLPGMLADSLPDKFGSSLVDTWLARQGRNPASITPVERLCYLGKRGMGALEFFPATELFDENSEQLEIEELVGLAKEALSEKSSLKTKLTKEKKEGLLQIISVGTSAGGARAKSIIAFNEKTGDVRSGQIDNLKGYAYWIIKFDGVTNKNLGDPKGYGRIEYAYYLMAKDSGISMAHSRLLEENNRAHFMTKRFDRTEDNTKLHLQTLCAIAHFDYNQAGVYSYEQAFQIMRILRLSYSDAEQLFMRMVFNVLARNQDDHTKNISFLMDGKGVWSLAPAYDMTYAFDPKNKWMKSHQMSINGKRENIIKEDLLSVAKEMNIKKGTAIIEGISKSIKKWKRFAKKAGIPEMQMDAIAKTHLDFTS